MQLMAAAARKAYPKTLGEGLSAIGEAIGSRKTMNDLAAMEAAYQRQAPQAVDIPAAERRGEPTVSDAGEEDTPDTAPTKTADLVPDVPPPQRTTTADVPPPSVPVAAAGIPPPAPVAAADSYNPIIRTNPDGTIAGNITAPTEPRAAPVVAPPAARPQAVLSPGIRDRIALAALQQQQMLRPQAVPPPNPTLPGVTPPDTPASFQGPATPTISGPIQPPDQRLALADTGTISDIAPVPLAGTLSGIPPAPPVPLQIRSMPQQVVAQAAGLPQAGVPSPETPPQPYEAPPSVGRAPPPSAIGSTFPEPPRMPRKSDTYLRVEDAYRSAQRFGDPYATAAIKSQLDQLEQARQEAYRPMLEAWQAKREIYAKAEEERQKQQLPANEIALREAELRLQRATMDERERQRLGEVPKETWIANLAKGREATAGLGSNAVSIARARALAGQMYTGSGADFETSLSKIANLIGIPLNPAASATEQFKQVMAPLMSQFRQVIVGAGSQSEGELRILQQATAADAKLTPETIKNALDAAESLNSRLALQHQQLVRRFAGDEPNQQGATYGNFGVPNMESIVPQKYVDRLFRHDSAQARKEFDDAFHTPGLAATVLRNRRYVGP
jgi:hypothetical protein